MPAFVILFFVNFIRTLLIILIIFYAIRLFTRFVLPYLLKKGVQNMESKMNQQYRNQQNQHKPTGEVTVEKGTTNQKQSRSYDGDYVDFEEVE